MISYLHSLLLNCFQLPLYANRISLGLCFPREPVVYQFSEYMSLLHKINCFYFVICLNLSFSKSPWSCHLILSQIILYLSLFTCWMKSYWKCSPFLLLSLYSVKKINIHRSNLRNVLISLNIQQLTGFIVKLHMQFLQALINSLCLEEYQRPQAKHEHGSWP